VSPAPARACALAVVRRVLEQGAFADRALHAEATGLEPRDRSLATAIAYGAVQRRATLDHVIAVLAGRPADRLDPPVRAALHTGLVQLLYMAGIADHAAVSDTVELVKRMRGGAGAAKLVNAVLRRAAREGRELIAGFDDDTPQTAALKHSVPPWLAALWWSELGPEQARALLAQVNEPQESAIRVNTLTADPHDLIARLPPAAAPRPAPPADAATPLPEGVVLGGPFDAHGSELFAHGALMPQSRGSMTVARVVDPPPAARVLDLCAAPGGKATHLAALAGPGCEVVAVERHRGRADALRRTCERMRCGALVHVVTGDAAQFDPGARAFDSVLVDPPCSGLGTLRSRPDLRWRIDPRGIAELAALQLQILRSGAAAVRAGGTLVYSVCTISRAESDGVIDEFLALTPGFIAERRITILAGTDGFFIARLRRD
jgi:16S rRNA (cytosine967-C5)-methyltransferase